MMLFQWFKDRAARQKAAIALYQLASVQSRSPIFYKECGVADTLDGRFDLTCLHVVLMTLRLREFGTPGQKLGQALFDAMFKQMAIDLREAGVGDSGLHKRIQKMMKAFNGRAHAYESALSLRGNEALELALTRNLYRSKGEAVPPAAPRMAEYARGCMRLFGTFAQEDFEQARVAFLSMTGDGIRGQTGPERTLPHA